MEKNEKEKWEEKNKKKTIKIEEKSKKRGKNRKIKKKRKKIHPTKNTCVWGKKDIWKLYNFISRKDYM